MALHTGMAEARDGDYFGPAVNRVARLLAAGHGEQVLLSLVTRELVRDVLPTGIDLATWASSGCKDLRRPEHIFQVLRRRPAGRLPGPEDAGAACRTTCRCSSPASSGASARWPR